MNIKSIGLCLIFTGTMVSLQAADVIVQWMGATNNYVSSSQNLNLGNYTTTDTGGSRTWNYSLSTQMNPQSGYTPETGYVGPFYGAVEATNSNGTAENLGTLQVFQNSATGDVIRLRTTTSVATDRTLKALIAFKKSDFLALSGGTVKFDADSSMSVDVGLFAGGTRVVRMAVLNGSQWYLSSSSASPAATITTFSIANCLLENWGAWNPATAPIESMPSSYATPGSSLTDIQAVGFYVSALRTATTAYSGMDARNFTVSAVSGAPASQPGSVYIIK